MAYPEDRLKNLSENSLRKRENQIFRAYSRVCIVAFIGLILSLCFFLTFLNHNIVNLKADFRHNALLQISALESRLKSIEELGESIQAFYASSTNVTKEELKTYTSTILARKNVNFISWLEINRKKRNIDKVYISARVVENEGKAVDFIFENKLISEAAEEVSRTGRIKVTLPFSLPYMTEQPEQRFVALVVPVSYNIRDHTDTVVDKERFFNVVVVALNITRTLQNTILVEGNNRSHIYINLSTPDINGKLLEASLLKYQNDPEIIQGIITNPYSKFSPKLSVKKDLSFGSSIIKVVIEPSFSYLSQTANLGPWVALCFGLLLTICAGYWLHLQISQNIKIQDIVFERTKDLNESNQALDDFVYIVSHDLKEPLRGIYAYSEFLIEDYEDKLDEDGKNKLQTLKRLSKRMEDLIETLLKYSRLGRTELAFKNVNMNEIVHDTLDLISHIIEEQKVTIKVQKSLPPIYCDSSRVSEIFRNLIVNGIKYNNSEPKIIEIGSRLDHPRCPGCITYFVKDNGIGIDEERYDDVFKMFKRLHGRDEYGGGTGSGLPIVKKIIERHNGDIWIESDKEKHETVFYFTLQK